MAEGALTPEDVVAGLHDIRLPSEAPGGVLAEILVAVGIGLLAAYLLSFLIPLLTKARREATKSVCDQLAESAGLPSDARALKLMHLLKEVAPDRAAELADGIYARGGMPSIDELEAAILSAGGADA